MKTEIIEEARSLCDEIAGECCEDGEEARGSIEIVTVLVNEIKRLRVAGQCKVGKYTLSNINDKRFTDRGLVTILHDSGDGGFYDAVALEATIAAFFNAHL